MFSKYISMWLRHVAASQIRIWYLFLEQFVRVHFSVFIRFSVLIWFSMALMKFHLSGINWHVFNQSECRNCCLYIIIQKIAPQAKSGKYFQIWLFPRFGGKNGGVLSMRMQVILDSSFARPGSAPIWGGKKVEFRDWTRQNADDSGKSTREKLL